MKTIRDSQRSKVYKAENSLKERKAEFPKLYERFDDMRALKRYIKRVVDSKWWQKYKAPDMGEKNDVPMRNPTFKELEIRDGRGHRRATAWRMGAEITFPIWARYRLVILHELAHILQSQRPGHGRQFCRVFIDLVRRFAGKAEADALKQAFRAHKVKYTKKKTGGNRRGNPEALRKWREEQKAKKAAATTTTTEEPPKKTIVLPSTDRNKRFVGFYSLMGEMCSTEPTTSTELMSRLKYCYDEEQDNVHRWMAKAKRGDHYKSKHWVVLCTKG